MLCCRIWSKHFSSLSRSIIYQSFRRLLSEYHEKPQWKSRIFPRLIIIKDTITGGKRTFKVVEPVFAGIHMNEIPTSPLESSLEGHTFNALETSEYHFQTHSSMDKVGVQTLDPPEKVRNMNTLDKEKFVKKVLVPGFRVPNQHVDVVSHKMRSSLLRIPKIRPIGELKDGDPEQKTHRLILLNPEIIDDLESFKMNQDELFLKHDVSQDSVRFYDLEMSYDNWTHQQILKAILPVESDGVAGFSAIGHILHLNLRDDNKDFKTIIGQVLLDKIPTAKTVVNKLDQIDNTFRNFEMEVLAGDDDFIATTKEHGWSFKLDFSKVYWNPRLSTEHARVVSLLNRHDIVLDVCAGIGPFSVPAGKKYCVVYANDLNPHSFHWLQENMKLNKVNADYEIFNLDGRDFLKTVAREKLIHHWSRDTGCINNRYHIIMNLPAIAVQFLDVFQGLFSGYADQREHWEFYQPPRVYCYAFTKAEDGKADIIQQAESHLGGSLGPDHVVRFVRNVAPNKDMYCVMFNLDTDFLFNSSDSSSTTVFDPPLKRRKADTTDI